MSERIDVLAVMGIDVEHLRALGLHRSAEQVGAARAAVAELIEAANRVNAGHTAPHDCYATGPITGNPIADLVACPGCALSNAIARVGGAA